MMINRSVSLLSAPVLEAGAGFRLARWIGSPPFWSRWQGVRLPHWG